MNPGARCSISNRRSAWGTLIVLRTPALRRPKTTKLTAIERARVDEADSVKPGDFRSLRAATRRSLQKLLFILLRLGEGTHHALRSFGNTPDHGEAPNHPPLSSRVSKRNCGNVKNCCEAAYSPRVMDNSIVIRIREARSAPLRRRPEQNVCRSAAILAGLEMSL